MKPTSVPARPTLDGLFTAEYVSSYHELVEDELIVDRLWLTVHQEFKAHEASVAALEAFAFGREPPGQFDTQAHARHLVITLQNLGSALGPVVEGWLRAKSGLEQMGMRSADVLAHRPGQMAIFKRADAPLEAPIDSPTLGPRVTDEDALVRDAGMNFF
jgi:hypothetical protein